jgi:anti-sigma factor RsiW
MKQDLQMKLQAYLDGELPAADARTVADLVARDAQAHDLLTELTHTQAAIVAHEAEIKLPVSREFYWSGIHRGIERQEKSLPPQSTGVPLFALVRRMLLPASGLVAVLLALALAWQPLRSTGNVVVEETETTFADAGAFTYRDYASGTTLVWVSYPAESDFAEMDFDDILDFN